MAQNSNHFFTKEEQDIIISAIKKAESETSGEIKVHVERRCSQAKLLDRATKVFSVLKMHKTKDRNGVLFYLASVDRLFAVIGDKGINAKVPENFWDDVKEVTLKNFKENHFAEGLAEGIMKAGDKLKEFFPHKKNDVDEISDEISFGKN